MNEADLDRTQTGLATVIVERLEQQRLPRALDLQEKVGRGERLDDLDIAFLEQVLDDAQSLRPFLETHPAYQTLAARTFALYKAIVARAAENEAAARG